MKSLTRLAALFALSTVFANAAASGGFGMFGPTLGFVDYSGLNSTLGRYGFDKLGSLHAMMGGAGYGVINRIIIGGGGWGGEQTVASESLNLRCNVNLGGGEFHIGYTLINIPNLIVAPMLGIGAAGYDITLQPATGSVPNFDSLLLHPGRTSSLSYSTFATSFNLAITVPVSFAGLHLRGGYTLMPGTPAWTLADGATLVKGPTVAKGWPSVSAGIIFGGFGRGRR